MDSVKGGFDIEVRTDSRYVVRVREDMADFAATAALAAGRNVVVVSDDVVDALYGDAVAAQFVGKSVLRVVVPHGEAHKAPAEYVSILNRLAEAGFTREDTVVALGGGVVGDLAGFAAATYMRGVRLIAVPTSLLAMVDSSVGGKTAINIDYGKNLCGAFYQPAEVYINTGFLSTLPPREMLCGWGEIIKYAFIDHTIGMTDLEGDVTPLLIAKCVQCKADVVSADEREGGLRKVLNLGHTVGHAIERLSEFSLSHGECVVKGLAAVLAMSRLYYGLSDETYRRALAVLSVKGHDLSNPYAPMEIIAQLVNDKKSGEKGVDMVLIDNDLCARIVRLTYADIGSLLL